MSAYAPALDEVTHWCHECFRLTQHDICAQDRILPMRDDEGWSARTVSAVRCRGCLSWSIRQETDLGDGPRLDPDRSYPPRLFRRRPDWLSAIEVRAPDLTALLEEVYLAANAGQPCLLSMGVRAVLDHVMVRIVGDVGSFERKLAQMEESGQLSRRQRDMLATVIDAGSAAVHRGYRPPEELLQQMMSVMEWIIRDHYVTAPMLEAMKRQIPPRPPVAGGR